MDKQTSPPDLFENLRDFRLTGDGYNVILQDFSKVSIDLELPKLGVDLARIVEELDIRLPVIKIERDGNGRFILVLVNGDVFTWPPAAAEDDEIFVLGGGDSGREADDLTDIVGIGATYQERLNAADIFTFAQLVTADVEALAAAVGANVELVRGWQKEAGNAIE